MNYSAAPSNILDQLFYNARTQNGFASKAIDDATIQSLYDLLKWGPTAFNCQPGRFVFLRSKDSRLKLKPCLMEGNQEKTMNAPLTVVAAYDAKFFEHLPKQFPAMDVKGWFANDAALAAKTAQLNASLQIGYLVMAARSLGLSVGPMTGFDNAAVDAAFFSEGNWKSWVVINLGYADTAAVYPRGPRLEFKEAAKVL